MRTLDPNTAASHPGHFVLDEALLRALEPELYSLRQRLFPSADRRFWVAHIPEHLLHGDSRAALVVDLQPLVVAAYTDELDCIAWLRFPPGYTPPLPLERGQRLLTVNTYARRNQGVAADLVPGPLDSKAYGNFAPFIAQLLSRSFEAMSQRVREIDEAEWQRCEECVRTTPFRPRDGRPTKSALVAR